MPRWKLHIARLTAAVTLAAAGTGRPQEKASEAASSVPPGRVLVDGDMWVNTTKATYETNPWNSTRVPYEISGAFSTPDLNEISQAIADWIAAVPTLQFVHCASDDCNGAGEANWIDILLVASGCSAEVGMQGDGEQFINMATECSLGNVRHEIGSGAQRFSRELRCRNAPLVRPLVKRRRLYA